MMKILHAETTKDGKHIIWIQDGIDVKKVTCDSLQIGFGSPGRSCMIMGLGKYEVQEPKTLNIEATATAGAARWKFAALRGRL